MTLAKLKLMDRGSFPRVLDISSFFLLAIINEAMYTYHKNIKQNLFPKLGVIHH